MRILYVGVNSGTTLHRFHALQRLGHDVKLVDPNSFIPSNRFVNKWIYETGTLGFSGWIKKKVLAAIQSMHFDFCLVEGGHLIEPGLVKSLKKQCKYVVNYNHDNILYKCNHRNWRLYRACAQAYDLIVVTQDDFATYLKKFGAKRIMVHPRIADCVFIKQESISKIDYEKYVSDVAFVGTWIPGRGAWIAQLLHRDVPVSIWGDRWEKSEHWSVIKACWRGSGVYNTEEYIKIIKSSKILLCKLSEGDSHTTRSLEIPAVGALLCAERTTEHLQMYEEGKEAVFWDDADECADICKELLDNPERCREIARRGHERCLKNNYFSEPTLKKIIDCAMGIR